MQEAMNDKILEEDIIDIANSSFLNEELLRNKSIFVTGATGLIGSQIIKTLSYLNTSKKLNMRLILLIKDSNKEKRIFGDLLQRDYFKIINGDILSDIDIEDNIDYIIHCACPTASKFFVEYPVETLDVIINGTRNVLELAKNKIVSSFVFLSSLEVYGKPLNNKMINEDDYGYIDNLNIRSSYSEGKRMAELMCISYCKEFNIPVKIARLSQTFGTGVEYNDNRVFAEFIRCAIEKKDIILHTQGNTIRTYCYTKDAITAILFLMLYGENGEAYNVTNADTAITIKEMAQLVCDVFKESNICVRIEIPNNVEKYGYNPEMVIKMSTEKINKLGWKASTGLEEMFKRMKKSIEYRI